MLDVSGVVGPHDQRAPCPRVLLDDRRAVAVGVAERVEHDLGAQVRADLAPVLRAMAGAAGEEEDSLDVPLAIDADRDFRARQYREQEEGQGRSQKTEPAIGVHGVTCPFPFR